VLTLKDLADRWGALVIAEGVETVEQLEFVRSLGIRAGQGYLLGVPMERPSTETVDLEQLIRDQGLRLGEGFRSVSGFGAGA
jgi:EAL domain-containing protein (putative c-di-GMP-specific phosphodiesterase class I)